MRVRLNRFAVVAPVVALLCLPFAVRAWASCPHTIKHWELCTHPDAVEHLCAPCPPAPGQTAVAVHVFPEYFGCASKSSGNTECVTGTALANCYSTTNCDYNAQMSTCNEIQDMTTYYKIATKITQVCTP